MTTNSSATRNRAGMTARPMPGQGVGDPRRFNVKAWLLWIAAFVSFPIAGIAAAAGQHPAYGPPPRLGEEPAGQAAKPAEGGSGKQRAEPGKQHHQRGGTW